ncbi:MAG: AAA domain-containing protein, partial [Candidatus Methanomethylophilaceae archaeon]|nr:AAA domain-containing protein [Candidatus Methanomethylophilaceae archaeon]
RGISEEIDDIESECAGLDAKIREDTISLDNQYKKKHNIESDNMDVREKISELEGSMKAISSFSDGELVRSILDRVREGGIDLGPLDEPGRLFLDLTSRGIMDLMEEYKVYADKSDYFALKAEKESTDDPKTITSLNERIWEYEYNHDFDPIRDLPTLHMLPQGIDMRAIKEVKGIAEEMMDGALGKLKVDLDLVRSMESDTALVDREITRLKNGIDLMKNNAVYRKREKLIGQFNSKAMEVFGALNKSPISSDRGDMLEEIIILRREANEMFGGSRSDIEDTISAMKRMTKYLRADGIVENDRDEYNPSLLKLVNIIGMTCTAKDRFIDEDSKSVKLNELNIDVVIIDEVSKVPFIELLQPILYGKTVILVGDHKQLPPIFTERVREEEMGKYDPQKVNEESERRYKRMYEESFFKTLFDKTPDSNKVMLNVQYRMHPDIMDAINVFYGGRLQFGGNPASKDHHLTVPGARGRPVIEPSRHILFVDCKGRERQESGSTSFSNEVEAEVVRTLLNSIDKCCIYDRFGKPIGEVNRFNDQRLSVGVICPYADQARLIRGRYSRSYRSFNDSSEERFMVKTVDDFQGDERDVIILSMVRTNPNSQFLSDFRRINVAASRARRLLIVVGNRQILEKMKVKVDEKSIRVYKDMIDTMERKGSVLSSSDILGGE